MILACKLNRAIRKQLGNTRDIIRETDDCSIRAARYVMAAINHPRDQPERLTGVFENFDRKMMPDTAQACIQRDNPHIQNSVHSKIVK